MTLRGFAVLLLGRANTVKNVEPMLARTTTPISSDNTKKIKKNKQTGDKTLPDVIHPVAPEVFADDIKRCFLFCVAHFSIITHIFKSATQKKT